MAAAALVRAMGAGLKPGAFRWGSVGEFRAWLHTIVDRQIADFWKARERTPKEEPLPDEHDESPWGVGVSPDETGAVDMQAVIDDALAELSPVHRQVVELHVFEERPARQAAEAVGDGMTEDNVHQIASRFRKRLRALLEEST